MKEFFLELRRPIGLGVVPSRIPLQGASPIVIGRGSHATVFLYAGEHPSFVSREHAKLRLVQGVWTIEDMQSVNGMFFNSNKLNAGEPKPLQTGDRVYFGNPQHSFFVEYEFIVRNSTEDSDHDLTDSASRCDSPTGSDFTNVSQSHLNEETLAADIWSCRIFPYLDLDELSNAASVSKRWEQCAKASLDLRRIITWRHPWSVDGLVRILQTKHASSNTSNPITTVVTEGCYKVRDDHVQQLAEYCGEHLTHIDLSGTPTVTARGMGFIANHCPNVKTLIVRGCKRVGARVGGAMWEWLVPLTANGQLEYCDLHCAGSTDEAITHLAKSSPNLKRLDIGVMCTEGVSDVAINALSEYCRNLEHLDLRGCKRVTDDAVSHLVASCGSRLKTLVLHSCDLGNASLRAIGENSSGLVTLDVHRCMSMTDDGVRQLVSGPAMVWKSLRNLDLSNLEVSDESLNFLAGAGVKLHSLDLRSCKNIQGPGLIRLAAITGSTLKVLDLNGCIMISPETLVDLADMCRGVLRELEIGAKHDEVRRWTSAKVVRVKQAFGPTTIVHDAFDFPTLNTEASPSPSAGTVPGSPDQVTDLSDGND